MAFCKNTQNQMALPNICLFITSLPSDPKELAVGSCRPIKLNLLQPSNRDEFNNVINGDEVHYSVKKFVSTFFGCKLARLRGKICFSSTATIAPSLHD